MSIIKNSKFYGFNPSLLYALMAVHLVCLKGYSVVIDFSDAALTTPPAETYSGPGGGVFYNGADGAGGFTSGGAQFNNVFTDFGNGFTSWEGWSYSTTTDTETPGFGNQYSAFPGTGFGDSVYGVGFTGGSTAPTIALSPAMTQPLTMRVANTTYVADSILTGDAFSKQFGGTSGNDPDWLLLTVTGLDAASQTTGMVEVYLADYRFIDNAEDYVVDSWLDVDLSNLGSGVAEIVFNLTSSDVGEFGMNTPAYFAMDSLVAVPEPATYIPMFLFLATFVLISRWKK